MKKLALNKKKITGFVLNKAVIILLIVFIIVMALVNRVFGTWENITNILAEFTVYGISACAMTILLISGEFDLSASSVFAWSTVLFVDMTNKLGAASGAVDHAAFGYPHRRFQWMAGGQGENGGFHRNDGNHDDI